MELATTKSVTSVRKRIAPHRSSLKKKFNGQSELVSHFEEVGHVSNFELATVVDTESFLSRRLTLEALHIYTRPTYTLETYRLTAVSPLHIVFYFIYFYDVLYMNLKKSIGELWQIETLY